MSKGEKKLYPSCKDCTSCPKGFGKCVEGHDNWYIRKSKKNGCVKCAADFGVKSRPVDGGRKPSAREHYIVYTDGGCAVNPGGPGGFGAVIINADTGEKRELSGGFVSTTNNRMEIMGVIAALEEIPKGSDVMLYSDSQYVVNCMSGAWSKSKNTDLWARADEAAKEKGVAANWVRGHNGDPLNERCDELATTAMLSPGKIPDAGYTGSCAALKTAPASVSKRKGAMSRPIYIPEGTDTGAHLDGNEDEILARRGIFKDCLDHMRRLNGSGRSFKDYLALKTFGRDAVSEKSRDSVRKMCGENVYRAVYENLGDENAAYSALRWYIRGLSLKDGIRKAMVDMEVSANLIKRTDICP